MNITTILGFVTGNWQRLAIYGLLILGALGTAAGWGYHRGVIKLYEYQAAQAREAVKIVVKQGEVTERVVNRYIKVQGETKVKTEIREKEVIKYVNANLDQCPVSNAFISLHDAAALNAVPDAARSTDGTASGIKTAETLGAVTENYSICHQTADRLRGLQMWVTAQKKANE